ncbi:MAG TPA: glycosyltransferase family 2 protein [Acidobacteriaceae bacterium]|jgi:glycosyltransferase involved in cell wall biosynthesis|nr:glycosyltransferase family 2 protein [Acidobacteriaceae bacterium]
MTVSVCMAAWNSARFIREQIASILPQLGEHDELVIVDDASQDDTCAIIESFCDARLRVVRQERNLGVVRSFAHALEEARGDIVFLADHDDIWRADKVEKFLQLFREHPEVTVAMSDLVVIDASGTVVSEPRFGDKKFHAGLLRNLVRNRYQGSAMAFRRSVLQRCLPFPADIPMHDQWIGLVNQFRGRTGFIPEPLLFYRRHGANESPSTHAAWGKMLRWRWAMLKNLVLRYARRRPDRSGS